MPQLTITVKNADIVRKGLQDLHAEIPKIGREQIYRTAQRIVSAMKIYPPAPAGSRYVRTYKLRNSWRITNTSTGYRIEADPTSRGRRYGPYVVGDARGGGQAWMHVGRWQLFRDVSDKEVEKLPSDVEEHLRRFVKAKGLS